MPRTGSSEQLTPQESPGRQYDSMSDSDLPEVQIAGSHARPERRHEQRDSGDTSGNDGGIDTDRLLIYGAKQIIRLFVPVTLCMLIVVVTISTIAYFSREDGFLIYTPFHTENADTGTIVWENLSNALIFISVIIVVTILMVLLYKYKCYKLIYGWLVFTSLFMLSFFCLVFFTAATYTMGVFVDAVTFYFFIWNVGVIGMISLYWKSPLIVQQAYLLFISSLIALFFIKYFPEWTVWFLLGLLAVWDLIAVLCPKGPLRILVEIAQERQETLMPAMIYSTTAVWALMADTDPPTQDEAERNSSANAPSLEESLVSSHRARHAVSALNGSSANSDESSGRLISNREPERMTSVSRTERNLRDIQEEVLSREDRGVKLGLGDFVFYSVLVGKASQSGDWNTTLACCVAILIGMCFTLLLLAIRGHALPALPISIIFGLIFFFSTSIVITPFTNELASQQVFI